MTGVVELRNVMWNIFFGFLFLQVTVAVKKDVVYVVDRSGSIGQKNFDEAIEFIYNVTEYLTIDSQNLQVSVMTFASDNRLDIAFNIFSNKVDLLNGINGLKGTTTSGGTETGLALQYTRDTVLTTINGARSGAEVAVVVLTDGQSTGTPAPETESDNLRANGAEVFSVGIGSALSSSNAELKGIASDPDSYYLLYVSSFVYLCNLVPELAPKLESTIVATLMGDCPEDPVAITENPTSTETASTSVANTNLVMASIQPNFDSAATPVGFTVSSCLIPVLIAYHFF